MRNGWKFGLLLASVGLAGPRPALAEPPAASGWDGLVAAGAAASADAWPVPHGSASGSGISTARPLAGELETAWTFESKGRLVDEPVVARERVVIEGETADGQRTIHVLSLATGRESYRKGFGPGPRLRPRLVGDRVVLQGNESRLEGHMVGQRMLTPRWEHAIPPAAAAGVLVHRGEVLVPHARGLEVLDGTSGKRRGSAAFRGDGSFAGGLAARDGSAYLLTADELGNLEVEEIELGGLEARPPTFVGVRDASAPAAPWDGPALVVGPSDLFVLHGGGVKTAQGAGANATWLERDAFAGLRFRTLFTLMARPTYVGDAWVGLLRDAEGAVELVRHKGPSKDGGILYDVFAGPNDHTEWARASAPLVATRDVVLTGTAAFRPETRDVVREGQATVRAIPVKDLLLVLEPPRTLRALRQKRGPAGPADLPLVVDPKLPAPVALGPAFLVLEDGSVADLTVAYDPTTRTFLPANAPKDKRAWPLDTVRTVVVRASPARLLFARSLEALRTDLASVADAIGAKGWISLAADAAAAGDLPRAQGALAEASRCDAPEPDLARVEKALASLAARPRARNVAAIPGLEAREAGLRSGVAGLVGELTGTLAEGTPVHTTTTLWRAALARNPADPAVLRWARERLPKGLALGEPLDAADALDLIESDAEAAVRVVAPPAKGQREAELTWSQKHLGAAMYHWRKDLVGIESGELLLLTPVTKPGRISHCLSLGRLVATTLEGMFASGTKVRSDPWPLVHNLYETKEEYLRESTKRDGASREAGRRGLEHTAGHFDPNDGVTRVYVPDLDDGLERIRSTYAHELTHHWMRARCPLYQENEIRQGAASPGAWLDEGLADFVAEMSYDLARRRVDTFSPTASFLDIVANAPKTLDWAWLYGAPQSAAYALSVEPEIRVPLRRRLGIHLKVSPFNMFYAQAAATSSYLWHAEGGRHRRAYVELVGAYFTGRLGRGEMTRRFGIDEATLGERVLAWSKRVVDGKGP